MKWNSVWRIMMKRNTELATIPGSKNYRRKMGGNCAAESAESEADRQKNSRIPYSN